jgi:hypothetical protein
MLASSIILLPVYVCMPMLNYLTLQYFCGLSTCTSDKISDTA